MRSSAIFRSGAAVCLLTCLPGLASPGAAAFRPLLPGEAGKAVPDPRASRSLLSPGTGIVLRLDASVDQKVEEGQLLAVLKTDGDEMPVRAHRSGQIIQVHVRAGDRVGAGQVLLEIKSPEEDVVDAKLPAGKKSEELTRLAAEATEREITASRLGLRGSALLADPRFQEAGLRIPPGSDDAVLPSSDGDELDAYDDALDLYEELLDEKKEETLKAELLYRIADCEFHLKKFADAAEHYEKLLKNYGGYIPFDKVVRRLRLLAGYYNEGKVSKFGFRDPYRSMELYELICKKAPSEPLVVNDNINLVLLYIQEEKYDKAIAQCQSMLKTYPDTREAVYAEFHLAKCYYDQALGKDQDCDFATQAEVLFSEFVKAHPDFQPLAQEAQECRRQMQERLSRHAYNIARFYWDSKYPASRKPYAARTYLYAIIADHEKQVREEQKLAEEAKVEYVAGPEPDAVRDSRALLAEIEAAGFTAESEGKPSDKLLRPGDTSGLGGVMADMARPPIEEVDPDKLPPLPPVAPEDYRDDPKKTWLLPFDKPLGKPAEKKPQDGAAKQDGTAAKAAEPAARPEAPAKEGR